MQRLPFAKHYSKGCVYINSSNLPNPIYKCRETWLYLREKMFHKVDGKMVLTVGDGSTHLNHSTLVGAGVLRQEDCKF